MEIIPQIFTAKVMHKRLFPKVNKFTYGVYYLALPLPAPAISNRYMQFDPKDLGYRDGRDPSFYATSILEKYEFAKKIQDIMLITMPRVLGYIFNPVSFYFCLDSEKRLQVVIVEVHNTFGEQHSYICVHPNHAPIEAGDWLEAEKLFHVSPFLERSGHYRFRFALKDSKVGIWINYFDSKNNKQLLTSLTGNLIPLNKKNQSRVFWTHPLVTLKTIFLIHWQALKLITKKITYQPKPEQLKEKVSSTLK